MQNHRDNCAGCHGSFHLGNPYVSSHDGVAWLLQGTPVDLHFGHQSMVMPIAQIGVPGGANCKVCHTGADVDPVFLGSSDGGPGFPPLGCIGCHGRAETAAGGVVRGAGERQAHYRKGVTVCADAGCHTGAGTSNDAIPATFAVVAESVKPPYYFTPDAAHPDKPTDPCNRNGSESRLAPPLGLDNDGDLVYDVADCGSAGVDPTTLQFTLEGLRPNPSRGELLRVAFALPSSAAARLELLDVSGRRVVEREVGALGAGRHVLDLAAGRRLAQGLYLVRLTQGANVRVARVSVLR